MKVYVVIPTYNEATNIESLLKEVAYPVIIVDDASTDGTAELAKQCGAIVIERKNERGIGSALRAGIRKALTDKECQQIVTMDADFSHSPLSIPSLFSSSALTIGSRYTEGGRIVGWNWKRKLTSGVANTLCSLLLYTGVADNTGNFRCYSRKAAEIALQGKGKNNEWLISALVRVQRAELSIKEVPITFTERKSGKSKLNWRHILSFFSSIVREVGK